jgi:hypothetical protein
MMNFKVYFKNDIPYRIYIPKNKRDILFKNNIREISIVINGKCYFKTLTNSFFSNCSHLDGAYNNLNNKGVNELKRWLLQFEVKIVSICTLEQYQRFELKFVE